MKIDVKKITIGCDPEFIIGCNEAIPAHMFDRGSSFGSDSDGTTFEVRPGYSHNVLDVVENIREILYKASTEVEGLKNQQWRAGGSVMGFPLGGHIHIGGIKAQDPYPFNGKEPPPPSVRKLILCLDYVLLQGLSNLIDDKSQIFQRRASGYYGEFGMWRRQSNRRSKWISHIEYRSPISFLTSPTVTFANLILAKIVSMKFFNCFLNGEEDKNIGVIFPLRQYKSIVDKMVDTVSNTPGWKFYTYKRFLSKEKSRKILKNIIDDLDSNPILKTEEDIMLGKDVLISILKERVKLDLNRDFREAWRIL